MKPKVLIACEFSGRVREAFNKIGCDAWSCDIIPTEIEGNHIQGDVLNIINNWHIHWDLLIAHPPCTYLSRGGCRWLFPNHILNKGRYEKGLEAKDFFLKLLNVDIPMIAVENPVPHKVFNMPKETQIIQPYYFGHKHQKATCLWLKNLPKLKSTNTLFKEVRPEYYVCNKGWRHSKFTANWNAKNKSVTFQGVADAMAEQWGKLLLK